MLLELVLCNLLLTIYLAVKAEKVPLFNMLCSDLLGLIWIHICRCQLLPIFSIKVYSIHHKICLTTVNFIVILMSLYNIISSLYKVETLPQLHKKCLFFCLQLLHLAVYLDKIVCFFLNWPLTYCIRSSQL